MANVIEYLLKLNDQMSGKLGKINSGLSDMQSRVSGGLRNLGGPFDDLANKIDGIPVGLAAVGAGVGALVAVGSAAVAAAGRVQEMALAYDVLAQKTGATVEFLSGFTEAADDVGISSNTVSTALTKFADNLFTLQGPSANVQASLIALADQFAQMPDGPAKTAIAINNFGKAGAEMIPILNQGSAAIVEMMASAQQMGLTVDASMVESAKRARDAQDQLNDSLTGLSNKIGGAVLPAVAGFVEQLNQEVSALERGQQVKNYVIQKYGELEYVVISATGRLGEYAVEMDQANEASAAAGRAALLAGANAARGGQGFIAGGNAALIGANKYYTAMNIIGEAAQAPMQYQRALQTNSNRMNYLLQTQARDAANSVNAYGARYTQMAVDMGRAIGASSANFEIFRKSVGGAGAAIKEISDEVKALEDRTNALKGALGQSTRPMGQVEQLQTAYAIATGEATVEQFQQEQAVKALLAALEQQKITQEQALTTVLAMREGLASSTDAFAVAGEAGATYKGEVDAVTGMVGTATGKISKMKDAIAALPKDTKVKVAADVYGIGDLRQARDMINSLSDRTVTITTIVRRIIQDGTGPGTGPGTGASGTNASGAGVYVNTPVTVKETNPRKAAAYMAHVQRQAARQAALRAQAGFMG